MTHMWTIETYATHLKRCMGGLFVLPLAACQLFPPTVDPEPPPEPSLDELLARCTYDDGRIPDSPSCHRAGALLVQEGRPDEAIKPLRYACTDIPQACMDLGLLHLSGNGVPKNDNEAEVAFAAGHRVGGEANGWLVYSMLQREQPGLVRRDAISLLMYGACDRATTGWPCYNYGVLLACGYFGDIDLPHALSAFHRGCFLADPRSCDLAGKLQTGTTELPCSLVGPDPKHPIELQLVLDPPDPAETWPEGEERFQRRPFRVER